MMLSQRSESVARTWIWNWIFGLSSRHKNTVRSAENGPNSRRIPCCPQGFRPWTPCGSSQNWKLQVLLNKSQNRVWGKAPELLIRTTSTDHIQTGSGLLHSSGLFSPDEGHDPPTPAPHRPRPSSSPPVFLGMLGLIRTRPTKPQLSHTQIPP